MSSTHRASSRVLIAAGAAVALFAGATSFGVATASAHVHVDAEDAAPGSTAVLTFQVPGESETGALTTQFSVTLPNVASARTELMPGWAARLDRDVAAGTVRSVTWTAAPAVGISPDQFGRFRISVRLPDQQSVTLPATQTYSDGTVVKWDQEPLPGGGEPEFPAPVLTLRPGAGEPEPEHHMAPTSPTASPTAAEPISTSDDTARWLAGAALIVAAVAAVTALVRGRRT